ncbi:predicted protein [Sclerotinia sclerotiorum 1980 UF-70]|uniref:Uncharacterized protein n=1 Tax=Sclerotinia sclerotiorum (strain ATCC 18683 / 1980 / Ss-1) TaxID=665079 RepID=A7ERD0_SCLS1|nr:predicted protein [Sclerotinia sclerotiorum 1980 UF-70]EDN92022.1 predicted protein [Sclerotinia sclerotiorum 1980 UF-70]
MEGADPMQLPRPGNTVPDQGIGTELLEKIREVRDTNEHAGNSQLQPQYVSDNPFARGEGFSLSFLMYSTTDRKSLNKEKWVFEIAWKFKVSG